MATEATIQARIASSLSIIDSAIEILAQNVSAHEKDVRSKRFLVDYQMYRFVVAHPEPSLQIKAVAFYRMAVMCHPKAEIELPQKLCLELEEACYSIKHDIESLGL